MNQREARETALYIVSQLAYQESFLPSDLTVNKAKSEADLVKLQAELDCIHRSLSLQRTKVLAGIRAAKAKRKVKS